METILNDPLTARKDIEGGIERYRQRMIGVEPVLKQVFA
jgi:hypothetical protein